MSTEKEWINIVWEKICRKTEKNIPKLEGKLPYISVDGKYTEKCDEVSKKRKITWWTNGFYGGLLWLLYIDTQNTIYRDQAEKVERILDEAFNEYSILHHDVGFLWRLTAGVNYTLTKNKDSFLRCCYASNLLAGRFNIKGGYIRAWNFDLDGYTIIDTMMNLPLLYWASEVHNDNRYKNIAEAHADMAAKCHIRPDGSVIHIVDHYPENGDIRKILAGQGMSPDSCWSRGQAWAVYGFILSYIHTKNEEYLNIAKKTAHYFIAAVCDDFLPRCDFRSPKEPTYYDSTAGAIAACGLLEIEKYVPQYEKEMYHNAAVKILMAMEEKFCNWDDAEEAILTMGTESYKDTGEKNVPIIYGDYFFVEALYKLRGNEILFW